MIKAIAGSTFLLIELFTTKALILMYSPFRLLDTKANLIYVYYILFNHLTKSVADVESNPHAKRLYDDLLHDYNRLIRFFKI